MSIANHTDRSGRNAWPCMRTIALESRVSEREAQYAIANLKEIGELEVILGGGRGRPNTYHLPLMYAKIACFEQEKGAQAGEKGCTDPPERVHTGSPEPSKSEPLTTEPSKERAAGAVSFSLTPDWIPIPMWLAFVKMRQRIRKPLTDYAAELIWREMEKLKHLGHDPLECLENSIRNGWQDVFPPRESRNTVVRGAPKSEAQRQAIELARQRHNPGGAGKAPDAPQSNS